MAAEERVGGETAEEARVAAMAEVAMEVAMGVEVMEVVKESAVRVEAREVAEQCY